MPRNHNQASVNRSNQVRSNHLLVSHQVCKASQVMPLRNSHPSGTRKAGNRSWASRKVGGRTAGSRRVGRCGGRRKVRRRAGRGRLGGRRKLLGLSTGTTLGSRSRLAEPGNRHSDRRARGQPGKEQARLAVRTLARLAVDTLAWVPVCRQLELAVGTQSAQQALTLLEDMLPEQLVRRLAGRVGIGLGGGCLVGRVGAGRCLGLVGGLGWSGRLCWLWRRWRLQV
ncbi:hypothetical protein [Kribbella sp. NPDC049584]|uniref:hypothetical protein n=1 Tax=Kribbella sp. NPDC049584 TaxID=3154833 RepID=UPI00342FE6E1